MSQNRFLKVLLAILALVICTGTMQAATLVANPTSVTLACDTLSGPTNVPVSITLAVAGAAQTVTVTGTAGLAATTGPVVMPASNTVSSITVATVFNVIIAPGCKGTNPGGTMNLIFTPTTGTALNVAVTLNITTNHGSALVPAPSAVSFTCNKSTGGVSFNGGAVSTSAATTVNVTSAATNGTPFTIGASPALPNWLTVSAGGTATGTAVALTVTALGGSGAGCALLASGTTTFNVQLLNAPAAAVSLPVSVVVGSTSPLSAATNPVAITHSTSTVSSAYNTEAKTTAITSNPTPLYFSVDLTTVPSWLSVNVVGGVLTGASTPASLNFQPASGVTGLYVGNYTANVHLKVSGYLDFVLPVSIQVNNGAPTLSILQGASTSINWVIGAALPTVTVTPMSTDAPIAFSVATSGALGATPSVTQGLAYNFGSPFTVSFTLAAFGSFVPGTTQSGTVTVTPIVNGTPGTGVVFTITVHIQPQSALITTISPSILPTAPSGSFTVAITGTGFVIANGVTLVGIVVPASSPTTMVSDSNVVAVVQNSTSIVLTITVPATSDPYLPFSGAGGSVTIGVCNPLNGGSFCSSPSGTYVLTIGINPIVSAVTSASSYVEATPATVAPYDILSIFGTNFCSSGGTGCGLGGAPALLYGSPSATTFAYPTTLSPDAAGATQRNLAVSFYPHGNATAFATAPLLFANNSQINLLAPAALSTHVGTGTVDMVVSFGYLTGATMLKSQIYTLNVAANDPGVFTVGGDGQGSAAALASPSYALITASGPAIMRTTAANSDIVQLYVTGLGVPDSNLSGSGNSATCVSAASYWAAVQAATSASPAVTSDDGLAIESTFIPNGDEQPCFLVAGANLPSVTVGGQLAIVQWAGWVQGAVAGLYQINMQLPSSTPTLPGGTPAFTYGPNNPGGNVMGTDIVSLPVVVTSGTKLSQAGVNLWVEQSLLASASCATTGTPVSCTTAVLAPPSIVNSNPVYTLTVTHATALPAATAAITIIGSQGAASGASYSFAAGASTGSVNGLALSPFPDDLAVDPATGILSSAGLAVADANGLNIEVTVTDATSGYVGNVIISLVVN